MGNLIDAECAAAAAFGLAAAPACCRLAVCEGPGASIGPALWADLVGVIVVDEAPLVAPLLLVCLGIHEHQPPHLALHPLHSHPLHSPASRGAQGTGGGSSEATTWEWSKVQGLCLLPLHPSASSGNALIELVQLGRDFAQLNIQLVRLAAKFCCHRSQH